MSHLESALIESIRGLIEEFRPHELAFYALTTKIEMPFRDRWAFSLHRQLGKEYIVAREWQRTDLTILRGDVPLILVELKAMYSFDAIDKASAHTYILSNMQADTNKVRKKAQPESEIYTVLLVTHPRAPIVRSYLGTIKYASQINRAVKKLENSEQVSMLCLSNINDAFADRHIVSNGILNAGTAFGIEVDVFYWLIKQSPK